MPQKKVLEMNKERIVMEARKICPMPLQRVTLGYLRVTRNSTQLKCTMPNRCLDNSFHPEPRFPMECHTQELAIHKAVSPFLLRATMTLMCINSILPTCKMAI